MRWILFLLIILTPLVESCTEKPHPLNAVKLNHAIYSIFFIEKYEIYAIISADRIDFLSRLDELSLSNYINFEKSDINDIFCSSRFCWIGGGIHQQGLLYKLEISNKFIEKITGSDLYAETYSIISSIDEKRIVTGHSNGEIIIWDSKQDKELLRFGDYRSEVFSLALSEDGNFLYSGKSVNGIDFWDAYTGQLIKSNKEIEGGIFIIVIIDNTNSIICGGSQGVLYIIDKNKLSITKKITIANEAIISCDIREKDKNILCGLSNGYISATNMNNMRTKTYKLHKSDVIYIKYICNGDKILSASKDGAIKIWNANDFTY